MGKDIIEQNIKDQLFDYVSPIDNDQLWAAINAKKNKNRGGLYLIGIGALLILALSGFYLMLDEPVIKREVKLVELKTNEELIINNEKLDVEDLRFKSEDLRVEGKKTNEELKINNEKLGVGDLKFKSEDLRDSKSEVSEKFGVEENETNEDFKIKNEKYKIEELRFKSEELGVVENETNQTNEKLTIKNEKLAVENLRFKNEDLRVEKQKTNEELKINNEKLRFKSEGLAGVEISLGASKERTIDLSMGQKALSTAFDKLEILNLAPLLNEREAERLKRKHRATQNQLGCFSHSRKNNNLSLFAYSGPEFIIRSMSTSSTAPNTIEYLEARKETEIVLESVRSGIMVKYVHESGLYGKLGIEYQRLNERLNFMIMSDSSYVLPNQLLKVDIDSNGDSIYTYGPVPVTVQYTKTWLNYNKYHFVNIPLLVGYQKEIEKWSFGAELGVILNNKMSFSGMILQDTSSPIDDPNYFKSSIGLSITGGFGVGYQIAPQYKIWATPSFKYDLNTINRDNYPIDQKYRTVGLLAGLELLF